MFLHLCNSRCENDREGKQIRLAISARASINGCHYGHAYQDSFSSAGHLLLVQGIELVAVNRFRGVEHPCFPLEHTVLAGIKEVLHSRKLQYICVANEIDPDECVPRLHVQIILEKTASLCCPFLLKYTGMLLFESVYSMNLSMK